MSIIQIKSQYDDSVLFECESESVRACLVKAVASRANLSGADLSEATGINKHLITPLRMLLDQPGAIRAYKLVTADGVGPFNGGLRYAIGESIEVSDANADEFTQCGAGINLATLDWCMKEWKPGYRILVAEFTAADIAAIPTGTDGEFRVRSCKIVGEKNLVEIGLVEAPKTEAVPS